MMLNIMLLEDIFIQGPLLSQKNHSTIQPVKYAQKLDIPINPVTFHLNGIRHIRGVVQTKL